MYNEKTFLLSRSSFLLFLLVFFYFFVVLIKNNLSGFDHLYFYLDIYCTKRVGSLVRDSFFFPYSLIQKQKSFILFFYGLLLFYLPLMISYLIVASYDIRCFDVFAKTFFPPLSPFVHLFDNVMYGSRNHDLKGERVCVPIPAEKSGPNE